jgi:thiamine-phosphate pyrophosphorylase
LTFCWRSAGLAGARIQLVSPLLRNSPPPTPVLCYVTDRHLLPSVAEDVLQELLNKIEAAAAAAVDWIQIREKDLSGKDCAQITRDSLRHVAKRAANRTTPARILVNDRLDVALAVGAGGVHLSERGLPIPEARRLVNSSSASRDFLVGKSCHSLEAAKSAQESGADYIHFGPIFATPSKAAFGVPQGLERLADVCRELSIPVIAIGGITLGNFSACLAAGASGIAAIRLFQDAPDIAAVVASLRELTS